ncbi:hypothetical protein HDU78_006874 [Chytriomyces hyalinus]|nr:hypothetical protein HDU78_006874 [Chytriomyces hyalinus]
MNPIIGVILVGVQSERSPLSVFKRDNDALRLIIRMVQDWWAQHVRRTDTPQKLNRSRFFTPIPAGIFVLPRQVPFPPPLMDEHGSPVPLSINMMPFRMSASQNRNVRPQQEVSTDVLLLDVLPERLKRYAPIVAECLRRVPREWGKVGYITVHESYVEEGQTQRRPGLHIESPGVIAPEAHMHGYHRFICWGGGRFGTHVPGDLDEHGMINMHGGIFVASNMADTCRVWDCLIEEHGEVAGHLGDISHMREAIGGNKAGTSLGAGDICWMTDRTPHESLPQPKAGFRQFFRLVTSELSAWYEEHNTPSELGVEPGCEIVKGNKFLNA